MSASNSAMLFLLGAVFNAALLSETGSGWFAGGLVLCLGFFAWDFGRRFMGPG